MLVYLFELDSVRNSNEEIAIGQKAMYEEIVRNGNQVVMSFNQLTDSEAFLSLIRDSENETYQRILALFQCGAIKVSLYNAGSSSMRTASQYMQRAVSKCIEKQNNAFIFSGMPVTYNDEYHLRLFQTALANSDLTIIEEQWQREPGSALSEEEQKVVTYMQRFARLILEISTQKMSSNPPKTDEKKPLMYFMNEIWGLGESNNAFLEKLSLLAGEDMGKIMPYAVSKLRKIKESIGDAGLLENRSNWHNYLKAEEMSDAGCMAEAIVDLCYNYTVEDSILNAAKHYSDHSELVEDIVCRLTSYWKQYRQGIHVFYQKDSNLVMGGYVESLHWDTALHIAQIHSKNDDHGNGRETNGYEKMIGMQRKRWDLHVLKSIAVKMATIVFFVFLFVFSEMVTGAMEDFFVQQTDKIIVSPILSSILDIVLFGIFSSLISMLFGIPDIIECIQGICTTVRDCWRYKKIQHIAYCRNDSVSL